MSLQNEILSERISFDCPKCNQPVEEKIGRLTNNPLLKCPRCGNEIQVKADQLKRVAKDVGERADDIERRLSQTLDMKLKL